MRNSPFVKALIFTAAIAGSAVLFGVLLKRFTNTPDLASLLIASAAAIFLLALITVFFLLIEKYWQGLAAAAVASLGASAPFVGHLSVILVSGVVLNFFILLYAYQGARAELKNNLTVRFRTTAHSAIGYASSGIAIFAIMAYLSLFNFANPSSLQKTLSVVIRPMEPLFARYIPNFSFSNTLTQVATSLLPDDLKLAPAEIKAQVIQQATDRLTSTLGGYIQVPIRAGDQLIAIVYKATLGKILNYSPLIRNLILVAAGLLVFVLLKFFLVFANWVGIVIAFGIYRLLLRSKFFEIQLQSIDKEVIVIK